MVCSKCGSKLLLWGGFKCPKCEDYALLNLEDAKLVSKKRVEYINQLWEAEIKKFVKDSILAHFTWQREKICRKFIATYSVLDLGKIFATTLFLKRVMKIEQNQDAKILDDETKAEKFVEMYKDIITVETDDNLLKNDLANILATKKHDLKTISGKESYEDFVFLYNEDYDKLMKSYENYNLLTPEMGEKKVAKHKDEAERLLREDPTKVEHTVEEFVTKFYDVISTLYIGLLRNRIFMEAFDLRPYEKLMKLPRELMNLVNQYNAAEGGISGGPTNEFLMKADKLFNGSIGEIKKTLVFEEENPDIFPLFVRTLKSKQDYILVSHRFSFLIYVFLHAVITKDLFEKEQTKKGKEFEKQVQDIFKKNGYDYIPNLKTKHLEIDGIAIKNSKCYIVEVKKYRFPTLVEESNRRENTIRDLKGIVDGEKFTFKSDRVLAEKIPSLLEKIEFVKNNSIQLGLNEHNVKTWEGIIVTIDYPWISEYKGVRMFALNEIKELVEN